MSNKNAQPVYWTQRNGQPIDVDLMTIDHLRNTLKMIIRNTKKLSVSPQASSIAKASILRGDAANEFHNSYPETQEDHDEQENIHYSSFNTYY